VFICVYLRQNKFLNSLMPRVPLAIAVFIAASLLFACAIPAADFNVFGRSGDAIEVNLGAIPGIGPGATFSSLNTTGFTNHTVLTSDLLTAQPFSTSGRLWVFANPARDTAAEGDINTAARGFQGTLSGSVLVNGVTKTFSVTVAPGYTGSGAGSVGQSSESMGDATNNPLFVAEQQQRLRYLGFVTQGGAAIAVDGDFGPNTDAATRTFQAAFVGGVNTTQADVDGIIGPNTAGWLNAQNAPTWNELIDPDPQPPGTFTIGGMIGNFDIYPGPDPGTGARTGNTPQPERFGVNWTIDLIKKGCAIAKLATGRTQRINAISMADGYGSSCCHDTHRVGEDIDLGTDSSTWNWGDGTTSSEEQKVISHAVSFVDANATGRVIRFITSNQDIYDGIHAARPSVALYYDTSGAHQNHLHIDVGPPTRVSGLANLSGDVNLDDVVDARDYVIWRANVGKTFAQADFTQWRANFGRTITNRPIAAGAEYGGAGLAVLSIPEPSTAAILLLASIGAFFRCRS
jgi:peptidoglycan hydrolase-like protein with peptidoglycan-binding domain